ncbi:MAG: YoaP domain-containing protein [Candidatus Cloacimonetes bacterium]|nr:YoaP domain-containing protein [Candidatus Cloacimonadota bacterium]
MSEATIIDTNESNIRNYGMCGYKNLKNEGYKRKVEWIKEHYQKGMKYKILFSEVKGAVGGIEYLPGEFAWHPVKAKGFMFIHCLYIMKREFKEKGYGLDLVNESINDAKEQNLKGVAAVTRNGSFMQGNEVFLKAGFKIVDRAEPDFELLVKKFDPDYPDPKFKVFPENSLEKYKKGLFIITSDQCPYAIKCVTNISKTAQEHYGIKPEIIEMKNHQEAQNIPCAFGSFCIILNGKIVADHPVSSRRFCNIMEKIL